MKEVKGHMEYYSMLRSTQELIALQNPRGNELEVAVFSDAFEFFKKLAEETGETEIDYGENWQDDEVEFSVGINISFRKLTK